MGIGIFELLILLVLLSGFVLWLIALVDILRNEFTGYNKIVWLLAVVFVPLIGAIVYLFIGRKQRVARPQ
ncbi:MAG: PLD nuclease N-terminal domain-containing protein [Nitrospirota bacterium]